jgi:nitrite reductase/ring-hydroxylating ferredoxin subunit
VTWCKVCRVADLDASPILQIPIVGRRPIAVYRLADGIYCTDDTCTHEEAPLSSGEIEGDCIVCPFHMGAFNIRTGEVERAPCSVNLRTYPVRLQDGDVCVQLDAAAGGCGESPPGRR